MEWNKEKSIKIVTSLSDWNDILHKLKQADKLAVDVETDGIHRFCTVVGIGLAVSEDEAFYVPIKIYNKDVGLVNPWKPEAYDLLTKELIGVLTQSKRLLAHNMAFDAKAILNTFNVNVVPFAYADTMLLHHTVINENPPHGLKELAAQFLTPEAASPQDTLKDSVLASGGKWLKSDKEMYKGDYSLLGTYCAYDVLYTYGLFNRFYPEVDKQDLRILWEKEVMPLLAVTFELNTTGLRVDLKYFEKLKHDMEVRIAALEDEIYAAIEKDIAQFELVKAQEEVTVTIRSEFGKMLIKQGYTIENYPKELLLDYYKQKKQTRYVFNLDSNNDKAFLLFDILALPCKTMTASGKRSVTSAILEELAEEYKEQSTTLKLVMDRATEIKLLNTYINPILENHVNGRIYPSFNQTGTTSGRYSSSSGGLNFQTLPRDDKRIKQGFIVDDNYVFVNADFSSLEPRCFADRSAETSIKAVYSDGLDLYSQVAIKVLGLQNVSAKEEDSNFLKNVNPEARQLAKVITLAIPYGAGAGRLSQVLNVDFEKAKEIYEKYMQAFPKLKKYMVTCEHQLKSKGFVQNLVGRKRRSELVFAINKRLDVDCRDKREMDKYFPLLQKSYPNFKTPKDLFFACKNEYNNAKNFPIQSLAASVTNAACIDFKNKAEFLRLDAKLVLQVHDEITVLCNSTDAERASNLLKECMESNWVTAQLSVPMKADPVVATNLAESK